MVIISGIYVTMLHIIGSTELWHITRSTELWHFYQHLHRFDRFYVCIHNIA